ncbi:hypothetical protein CCE01nite_05780 [Cellulomonas cellasea]|uniref:Uncharacterized protein n=1 Tax=Cellulomonas cellasea TaxID=43670 RepID=A0A4Y3KQF0_9CELL|nr:hypothetical protein CCE01nite_05780 [Cellulomonas cellasea]
MLTPERASRRARSYPMFALAVGLAFAAAVAAVPTQYHLTATLLVAPVVLCGLATAAWRLDAWRASGTAREPYGMLAVVGSLSALLLAALGWAGPLKVLAMAVVLLGVRGRDVTLLLPGLVFLAAPVDLVGLARVSAVAHEALVPVQLVGFVVIAALALWARRSESTLLRVSAGPAATAPSAA